jgi:hypothetical protein
VVILELIHAVKPDIRVVFIRFQTNIPSGLL